MKKLILVIFLFFSFLLVFGATKAFAVYCGDGWCVSGEDCYSCSADCGACPTGGSVPPPTSQCTLDLCGILAGCNCYEKPDVCKKCPGSERCGGGFCPNDNQPWSTYCSPNCTAPSRTCHNTPECSSTTRDCNVLAAAAGISADQWCTNNAAGGSGWCGSDNACQGIHHCGPGGNCYVDCTTCPTPRRWTCSGCSCMLVNGSGTNDCTNSADCCAAHSECRNYTCVSVPGAGTSTCRSNSDCVRPTGTPNGDVCGYVKNPFGGGISGVTVSIYNGAGVHQEVTTNSSGYFSKSGFIPIGWAYAVRPTGTPVGYIAPAKSTTVGWCWQQPSGPDTPTGSSSYESQKLGTNDCASGHGGSNPEGPCRCSFKFDCPPIVNPALITCDYLNNKIIWSSVAGASKYPLRVNDLSNPWTGKCDSEPGINLGDVCKDVWAPTHSINFTFGLGKKYSVWVHSISACDGSWGTGGTTVTCEKLPACVIGAPTAPTLSSPAEGTTVIVPLVNFQWNAPSNWGHGCPDSKSYKLYVYKNTGSCPGNLSSIGVSLSPGLSTNYSYTLPTEGSYCWQVIADNSAQKALSAVRSFTYITNPPAWFQTTDGDIHANDSITSLIPGSCAADSNLSVTLAGGSPGVVSWRTGSLGVGTGSVSSKGWQAKTGSIVTQTNYEYLMNRLNVDITNLFHPASLPPDSGTYYSAGSLSLNNWTIGSGKKFIIFVNGDVTVTGNIIVPSDGFFALVAKGKITFNDGVTRADGFYLANEIEVAAGSNQFSGQGSFVGLTGISFGRDLVDNCTPAESFSSRPDLFINAPPEFQYSSFLFQEVAP